LWWPRRSSATKLLEFFASLRLPSWARGLRIAHHWARELIKLGRRTDDASGLCEAYVRRQKNDAADAAAICGR